MKTKKVHASRFTSLAFRQGGYTLFELAVTIFIIITITLITRFGKTEYERSLALTNLAYDIALAVRQAQVYGVNTRQADVAITSSFDVGYGVRFAPNATSFLVFTDKNNDRAYTAGDTTVRNGLYIIKNGNKLGSICAVRISDGVCQNVPSVLGITFRRPDPDACFNPTTSGIANALTASACLAAFPYSEARINVVSSSGNTKIIKVYSTGQVVVQ